MNSIREVSPNTINIFVNPSAADTLPVQYARVSLPLARGDFAAVPDVQIKNSQGETVASHCEFLTTWPDGSPRMLHAILIAPGGEYQATLNDVSTPAQPLEQSDTTFFVAQENETVTVGNGNLRAVFAPNHLLQSLLLNGREMIGAGGIEMRVEDGQGNIFTATACQKVEIEVEQNGPLRAVVELRGQCSLSKSGQGNKTFLNFRWRFEFLAGVEGFSLSCAFYNLERGQDFFDVGAIELDLKMANATEPEYSLSHTHHGIFGVPQVLTTSTPLHIVVDDTQSLAHVADFDTLADTTDYPFYLEHGKDDVSNWAVVSDGARRMIFEMDDFHLLRPKDLRLNNGAATFGIWPREAGVLSLQQGRSREITIRVAFAVEENLFESATATVRIAQLRDVWRAQLLRETYAATQFFDQARVLPFDYNSRPRFENWLEKLSYPLHSVARFFDLGDTPDSGYRSTYTPLGRQRRVRGEDGGARWFSSGYGHPALAMNDMEDFEPVWVNNEYDVIFALGTEYLRTADCTLFQKLKWFSRHTIEVDFLHYSDHKWLHRAQPAHSAQHTTTGAYPSHFWTQGLAQYYMLTGDKDALEIIIALADKTIENFDDPELGAMNKGLNREVGWGVLSLVCAYEASGDKRYDDYARRILDDILAEGLPPDLPNFSFGHTSMLLAARQYLQVHDGENDQYLEVLKKWFLSWVDLAIDCARQAPQSGEVKAVKSGAYDYTVRAAARGVLWSRSSRAGTFETHSLALDCLAYAHEISGDKKYIEGGLRSFEHLLDSPSFLAPTAEGKPFAMLYRTWMNYLAAANEIGILQDWEYKH